MDGMALSGASASPVPQAQDQSLGLHTEAGSLAGSALFEGEGLEVSDGIGALPKR